MRDQDVASIVACIPNLRRYARWLAADATSADDLVQDTLERAWSRFSLWQQRGDLRAWLFGIMHNHFIDTVRSTKRRLEDSVGDELPDIPQRAHQADRLEVRDLDCALQRLPAEQRMVLLLVAIEEMSYVDAATVIGIPVGTVMSRLARGRQRLRQEMQGHNPSTHAAGQDRVRPRRT